MSHAEPNASAHSYEVLGKLADGGTTEIFLARAKEGGVAERFVVLKRLKRSVTGQVELVKEFLDEATLASHLQHANVAQVFEVGKLGGSYFFAMEFVNGETLQSLIEHARTRKMQIPVRAVLTIASALAAGLHHAHTRIGSDGQPLGIVHGNVSPTNTLVSQDGIVKLVDFGIVRAGEQSVRKVSPYTSPEQCWGQAIDRRTDLYALGVVVWEMLTLEPLYARGTEDETRLAIETEQPIKPSAKRYDVPPELDALVLKLVAKEPADRFQDADEVLATIEALAQKLSILLSTADMSRMVRLWFGTKSDPTIDPSAPDPVQPVLVRSEQVPDTLERPNPSLIDAQLDAVRSAAALITTRATERAGSTTGRQDRTTVPPELMDNPNENFEQIRDRILARARQKKETARNQIMAASTSSNENTAASGTPVAASQSGADDRHTRTTALPPLDREGTSSPYDQHTRKTTPAPIPVVDEALLAGVGEGPKPGSNGHSKRKVDDSPDAPDKVVVDADANSLRSGVVGGKGTSTAGVITRGEPKVDVREAPPVKANVAKADDGGDEDADLAEVRAAMAASRAAKAARDVKTTGNAKQTGDAKARVANGANGVPPRAREDAEATERLAQARASTADIVRPRPARSPWLMPVFALLGVVLAFLILLKVRGGDQPSSASGVSTKTAAPATHPAVPAPVAVAQPEQKTPVANPAPVPVGQSDVAAKAPAETTATADQAKVPVETTAIADQAKEPLETTATADQAKDPVETAPAETKVPVETKAPIDQVKSDAVVKKDPVVKRDPVVKKDAVVKKEPEPAVSLVQLYASGEFEKTNAACTKEVVFTAEKLQMCALSACQTKNIGLAKRWTNAISRSARPTVVERCKELGLELEPPAAPAP